LDLTAGYENMTGFRPGPDTISGATSPIVLVEIGNNYSRQTGSGINFQHRSIEKNTLM